MAVVLTSGSASAPSDPTGDMPRPIVLSVSRGDRIFRGMLRAAGITVLTIIVLILLFLVLQSLNAFRRAGLGFLTNESFSPSSATSSESAPCCQTRP